MFTLPSVSGWKTVAQSISACSGCHRGETALPGGVSQIHMLVGQAEGTMKSERERESL